MNNKKKIALFGGLGKLGSAIASKLKNYYDFEIFDTKNGKTTCNFADFDLVIDASHHTNTNILARACAKAKTPLLVCATGHTKQELSQIENCKTQTPIEICPNLSFGISAINNWLNSTTFEHCNVSIFEQHHAGKKDFPSGTAIMLENTCKAFANTVEVVSSRFGDEIGTHVVTLDMPTEQIIICHKAKNRDAFAAGAKYKIEQIIREHNSHEN